MIPINSINDHQRGEFLRKLDKSELNVTDWEARFIETFLHSSRPSLWFTPGRRTSCDKMILHYGHEPEIQFNFPEADQRQATIAANIPAADPSGCQFLVMDDSRRQSPCNAPAEKQRRDGFRYCATHAEQVQTHAKRRGKVVTLFDFQPKEKP